jgi:phosphomannomutase
LLDELDTLESTFGVHAVDSLSIRVEGVKGHDNIKRALEALLFDAPVDLGGSAVTEIVDLSMGYHQLAPTEGLVIRLGTLGRVTVRPSGTEPKVKLYGEIVSDPCALELLASVRKRSRETLDDVLRAVHQRLMASFEHAGF